jgi:hypothetical protein
MKTFGQLETQELVSLQLADDDTDPANVIEIGGDRVRIDTIKPRDAAEDWTPPTIVPLVKLPQPEDTLTHYSEPKLVWFEDRVERDWEILPIPQASLEQQASEAARKAIRTAEIAKRALLYADYTVQPEGFRLATQESDQNAFTRLITLANTAGLPDEAPISIADSSGGLHSVTVGRLKEIVVAYGLEIFQRWTTLR